MLDSTSAAETVSGSTSGLEGPDLLDVADDLDAVFLREHLLGDGAGGHPADGLPGACPAAALPVPNAVFGLVRVVGVRGPELRPHVLVVFAASVLVPYAYEDRGAQRAAFEYAGQYLGAVRLPPLGRDVALPWAAAVEVSLQIVGFERDSRGASVYDHTDGVSVRLAPGGNAEDVPEAVAHSPIVYLSTCREASRALLRCNARCNAPMALLGVSGLAEAWTLDGYRVASMLPSTQAAWHCRGPVAAPGSARGRGRRMAKAPPGNTGPGCNTCEYLPLRRMSAARSPGPFRGCRQPLAFQPSSLGKRSPNSVTLSSSPESGEGGRPLRRSGGRSRTCCRC